MLLLHCSVEENTSLRATVARLQQDLDKLTAALHEQQHRAEKYTAELEESRSETVAVRNLAADRDAYVRQLEEKEKELQVCTLDTCLFTANKQAKPPLRRCGSRRSQYTNTRTRTHTFTSKRLCTL